MVVVLLDITFMTGTMIAITVTIVLAALVIFYLIRISTYARGFSNGKEHTHHSFQTALEKQVAKAVTRPGKLNADYWDGYADACSDLSKTIESGK